MQSRRWDELPYELKEMIILHVDISSIPSCLLVCHEWKALCDHTSTWKKLVCRDLSDYDLDVDSAEVHQNWKAIYRNCCIPLAWETKIVDDSGAGTFVFSKLNTKLERVYKPGSSCPKVVSASPVRARRITVKLRTDGEIGLVHVGSPEEWLDWCSAGDRTDFHDIRRKLERDWCYYSAYRTAVEGNVAGQTFSINTPDANRARLRLDITMDAKSGTVRWELDGREYECPMPPRPVFLMFGTGSAGTHAKIVPDARFAAKVNRFGRKRTKNK